MTTYPTLLAPRSTKSLWTVLLPGYLFRPRILIFQFRSRYCCLPHHHTTHITPVPAAVPRAPTASSSKPRPLQSPSPVPRTALAPTSSSDRKGGTRGFTTDTTSSGGRHGDGLSSRTSRGHSVQADYTLGQMLGVGSMGKVKFATHITGEEDL